MVLGIIYNLTMRKSGKIKKNMSVDDLAVMVQKGFLGLDERIGRIEVSLKKEIREVRDELKLETKDIKFELNRRVHIFDHKDLEYRVEKLEEKVGIGRRK